MFEKSQLGNVLIFIVVMTLMFLCFFVGMCVVVN